MPSKPQTLLPGGSSFASSPQTQPGRESQAQYEVAPSPLDGPPVRSSPRATSPSLIAPSVLPQVESPPRVALSSLIAPPVTSSSLVAPHVEPPPRVASPSLITPPVTSPPSTTTLAESGLVEPLQQQLEGLEGVDIQQFAGVEHLRRTIYLHSGKLPKGVITQQYLVFKGVSEVDLAKISSEPRHHARLTYFSDTNLLILKMPTAYNESAHLELGSTLLFKVMSMGIPHYQLRSLGATEYAVCTSSGVTSKEGDTSYKPYCRNKADDWPTIVIESGCSESLLHLRSSARWWLQNSHGEVKVAIVISVQREHSVLHIEKWQLTSLGTERPPTRSIQAGTPIPTRVQKITITPNTLTGSLPLVLEFQDIFLRPAVPPESDIIFTAGELSEWAKHFWEFLK